MLPDRVSNPGPLTYESGALPIALRGPARRNEDIKYTMNTGQEVIEIETVTSERDLGIIMDKALNFSEHIKTKVNKANRNFGIIFRTFTYMDKEMFLNLYKSLVRPHLEYAVTVCAPLYKKDMVYKGEPPN